jgi:hypothetical protein
MIQRIQSLLLLLVVAICVAMFFVPIYKVHKSDNNLTGIELNSDIMYLDLNLEMTSGQTNYNTTGTNYMMRTLDIALLLLSLGSIFMFRKRNRQLVFTRISMIFSIIFLAVVWYCIISLRTTSQITPDQHQFFLMGAWFPIFPPILLYFAGRAIQNDIKVVKSADRLR